MMKLDYSITSPEERRDLVDKIIAEVGIDNLNPKALEIMTDYIIFCMEKQEKKQKVKNNYYIQSLMKKK